MWLGGFQALGAGFNPVRRQTQGVDVGKVGLQLRPRGQDGRMASFSPGIASPGGQLITALSYNQDAQLSAVDAGSTTLASYTYNGFGQRVLKAFPGGTGEIYQYGQNGMLLEETDQSGTPQADYIYLNGRPIATLNPATGTLYYLQDDRLGTPQLATDSNQTVAWQAAYGPFGQASVSGSITQNLRFPGQYYDIETGWNHNGFRDYIPELGRYAEPDPLAMPGSARFYAPNSGHFLGLDMLTAGINAYLYVADDPTDLVDLNGLQPLTAVQGQAIATIAAKWQGTPYRSGGHTKHGADCSGSTWAIYAQAGFKYAPSSVPTYHFMSVMVRQNPTPGYFFPVNSPQPGDVMLWPGHHMAIYDSNPAKTCGCNVKHGANMWSATHPNGHPYGGYDSNWWFGGRRPVYLRYDTPTK